MGYLGGFLRAGNFFEARWFRMASLTGIGPQVGWLDS